MSADGIARNDSPQRHRDTEKDIKKIKNLFFVSLCLCGEFSFASRGGAA